MSNLNLGKIGGNKMLIMDIVTWEPEKAEEFLKHRTEEKIPEGVKLVGEWADLAGGRGFRLVEVADPRPLVAMTSTWFGLCKKELVPVMATEDLMKLMPGR
jgi:hypothetical protein